MMSALLAALVWPTWTAPMPLQQPSAEIRSLGEALEVFHGLRRQTADHARLSAALEDIGRVGTTDAADALVDLLPDLPDSLQMSAVHAIGFGSPLYITPQLRELALDSSHQAVRRQAYRELTVLGPSERIFLRDRCYRKERESTLRGELLRQMLQVDTPGLSALVLEAGKSKEPVLASAGIYGIGTLQLEKGRRRVEEAAASWDMPLRRDAFQALARLGGAASMRFLLESYEDDSNLMLRGEIAQALLSADDEKELRVLIRTGLKSQDASLVLAVMDALALAAVDHPEFCTPALVDGLASPDEDLRSQALEGLVRCGAEEALPMLLQRLQSSAGEAAADTLWAMLAFGPLPPQAEPSVMRIADSPVASCRVQSALAMRHFPDSVEAFAKLLRMLTAEEWAVRSAAAESLAWFPREDLLPVLIDRMEVERGRVQEDLERCLRRLTGQALGPAAGSWRLWMGQCPAGSRLSGAEWKEEENASSGTAPFTQAPGSYHGILVPHGGVMFAFDISGSMANRFDTTTSLYRHYSTALASAIDGLTPATRFNVLLFSSSVASWSSELAAADEEQRASAQDFLRRSRPGGGTNLMECLRLSLSAAQVETLFLFSDGVSTVGSPTAPQAMLRRAQQWNRHRRIRIHTIATGTADVDFLAALAVSTGGQIVDLTR